MVTKYLVYRTIITGVRTLSAMNPPITQSPEKPPEPTTGTDWIDRCLSEAQSEKPVNQDVLGVIRAQLVGVASERPLRPSEVAEVGKSVLASLRGSATG
jgi:hypothetical protein